MPIDADQYARVKQIFMQALTKEESERDDFVRAASAGDASIRDEVFALLAHHEEPKDEDGKFSERSLSIVRSAATVMRGRWLRLSQRRSLRLIALAAIFLLMSCLGWWTQYEVQRVVRVAAVEQLRGVLEVTVSAFEIWSEARFELGEGLVQKSEVHELLLNSLERASEGLELGQATAEGIALNKTITPLLLAAGFDAYGLIDREYRIVASTLPQWTGVVLSPSGTWVHSIVEVFLGIRKFIPPHILGESLQLNQDLKIAPQKVVQFVIPVRDRKNRVVAGLVLSMGAEKQYQRLLSEGHTGQTMEIYTFDKEATMLSESRFASLESQAEASSMKGSRLKLMVPPSANKNAAPALTQLVQNALSAPTLPALKNAGGLSEPYLDYRGVPVIGSWRWLPAYGIGFAAEADVAEVSLPLGYLKLSFALILALLGFALISSLLTAFSMLKLKREIAERKKIGNYRLLKKLGEGGIGEVYLARHDLIRRPTAIKILKPNLADPETIARFEREVQMTCRLTEPHTVSIYDFGRTSDGTFYYVMEYLRGIDLGRLIHLEGRIPYGRVVHLLAQACRSLVDAHAHGLIHRDIKPQNIMVTKLGGESDFVKVVDFGLVKDLGASGVDDDLHTKVLRGTPLYTAPERFRDPSQVGSERIDIYALGATAYKMCSGRNLFSAATEPALMHEILTSDPLALETICPDCPAALSSLIMRSVARQPEARPSTMRDFLDELLKLQKEGLVTWSEAESDGWWQRHPDLLLDASLLLDEAAIAGR